MSRAGRVAIALWLSLLAASLWVTLRAPFTTDLSAFLPRSPTPAQQILVDQLREGAVSRLILIGIEGASTPELATLSTRLTEALSRQPEFVFVVNGAEEGLARDADVLLRYRYLLSASVAPERFSVAGLRAALEAQLDLLASPLSPLVGRLLPADPTGELIGLLERLQAQGGPPKREGVWFARAHERALILVQTRAAGFDIDAQQQALARIRAVFDSASREAGLLQARLLATGPGVFAVESRAAIKADAMRLSTLALILVATLLLVAYRSPRTLMLILLPVGSGALVGAAAVALAFGTVHGVTLGFGATLIGECVDYPIYLFTHSRPGGATRQALMRIWPTLRLGVLTSIIGFSAMLLSDFAGLAQLGLFSVAGLAVAMLVTRWVLPELAPRAPGKRSFDAVAPALLGLVSAARLLRYPVWLAVAALAVWLVTRGSALWSDDLNTLSPVPESAKRLDAELRRDLGAPDVRQVLVVRAPSEQAALESAERAAGVLERLLEEGAIAGFDSPATYLPSAATQRARQAALPEPQLLRANLREAARGLPFQPEAFELFAREVEGARTGRLLQRSDLAGTGLGLKVESLLLERHGEWLAMLALRGVAQPDAVAKALSPLSGEGVLLLDLKREADQLYSTTGGKRSTTRCSAPPQSRCCCSRRCAPHGACGTCSRRSSRRSWRPSRSCTLRKVSSTCFTSLGCCWWWGWDRTTRCSSSVALSPSPIPPPPCWLWSCATSPPSSASASWPSHARRCSMRLERRSGSARC